MKTDSNTIGKYKHKFRALVHSSDYLYADIYAKDSVEAWEIARALGAGCFTVCGSEWDLVEIKNVAENDEFDSVNS